MPRLRNPADLPRFGWTAERVLALPPARERIECIDGELFVSPGPGRIHQFLVGEVYTVLRAHVETHGLGRVWTSPADVILDELTLVQPDVFVEPPGLSLRAPWKELHHLLLTVEVLSPSSGRADREVKRERYQRAAIPEYWLIDPDAARVERWRPTDAVPEIARERLVWAPGAHMPVLEIDVGAWFRTLAAE